MFSDWVNKEVKMILDINNMVIMFLIGNMEFCGIISMVFGDFLVCICYGNFLNVVWFSFIGLVF